MYETNLIPRREWSDDEIDWQIREKSETAVQACEAGAMREAWRFVYDVLETEAEEAARWTVAQAFTGQLAERYVRYLTEHGCLNLDDRDASLDAMSDWFRVSLIDQSFVALKPDRIEVWGRGAGGRMICLYHNGKRARAVARA